MQQYYCNKWLFTFEPTFNVSGGGIMKLCSVKRLVIGRFSLAGHTSITRSPVATNYNGAFLIAGERTCFCIRVIFPHHNNTCECYYDWVCSKARIMFLYPVQFLLYSAWIHYNLLYNYNSFVYTGPAARKTLSPSVRLRWLEPFTDSDWLWYLPELCLRHGLCLRW